MEEKRLRILNLEDEDVDHLAFLRMVKGKGISYDIDRAVNIAEAMELLTKNSYDAVLLDYRLPDGTGIDLLEKLKGTASIFVTGSGDEMVAVNAMKGGANDYVIKDPSGGYLDLLPTVIEKSIETVRLRREKEEAEEKLREKLDIEERMNKLLLKREFRIKELKDENERLKKRIEELEKS